MNLQTSGPFAPAGGYNTFARRDDWLVPGLLPSEGVVVLASAPKVGKTCFATALGRAIVTGVPFLGQTVGPSPILYCAYEETMLDRKYLYEGLELDAPFFVAYPFDLPPWDLRREDLPRDSDGSIRLGNAECPFIFEHAINLGAKLIVVDSLHAATDGADLADNAVARRVMASLYRWCSWFHVTVLLLHHLTKVDRRRAYARRIADSSQILAAATAAYVLDREELPDGTSRVILEGGGRYPVVPTRLELISASPLDYRLADASAEPAPNDLPARRVTAAERIVAYLEHHPSATAHVLARDLQLNPATVRQALSQLAHRGQILSSKTRLQHTRYALQEPRAEELPATS